MGWLILAGVVALPVAEIMVWMRLAEAIGGWNTVLATLGSFLAGIMILRRQGLAILLEARARLELGETPVAAAFDGLCLALAGALFVLPGFISDGCGLLLLLPPVRHGLRRWMAARMVVVSTQSAPAGSVIIDGDFKVVDAEAPPDTKRLEP